MDGPDLSSQGKAEEASGLSTKPVGLTLSLLVPSVLSSQQMSMLPM